MYNSSARLDLKDHKGENLYHSPEDPILPRPPHHLSGQKVGIDFTRPRPCAVMSTIRGLSKLGVVDTRNKATGDKIAELVG